MGRLGAWVSLLVAAAIGLSLAAPGFAAAPGPSVEIAGESATEGSVPPLQPAPVKGKPTESTLQVPLVVRRAGLLRIEYIATATGTHLRVGRHSSGGGLSVTAPALPLRQLRPGEVLVLGLHFMVPAGQEEDLPGVISLGTAPALPLVRRVEAPAESGGLALTQKKVEISATRVFPIFFGTPEASATVGIVGAPEAKGSGPLGSSYLTFNHGGHAAVAVALPSKEGSTQVSRVSVTEASGVGTASTVVDLGGHEKASQQLEVVVTVGDSLIAPLLVVLIGALLGKLVPTLLDTRRQRGEVESALLEAQEEYDKALAEAEEWTAGKEVKLPTFDPELGLGFGPDSAPPKIPVEGAGKLASLVQRLGGFRRPSDLEKDSEEAEDLINALKAWVVVVEAMQPLAEKVPPPLPTGPDDDDPPPPAPLIDSEVLLRQGFEVEKDLSRWTDLAAAIHGQALILEAWDEVAEKRAATGASAPSPGAAAYAAAKPPLVRSPDEIETLLAVLRKELFVLETQPKPAQPPRSLVKAEVSAAEHAQRQFRPGTPLARLAAIVRPSKAPTPESIMASVRRGDWLLAIAAFLVSSLLYLLPIYGSGPFGTWQQYLGAFVAGAGGQVTVSVLIPWARSYKFSPTAPPAAPTS